MILPDFISALEEGFGVRLDVTRHEYRKQWYVLVLDGRYRGGWTSLEEGIREIAKLEKK